VQRFVDEVPISIRVAALTHRVRTAIRWVGTTLMILAAGTLAVAFTWQAPEVTVVAGAYGGSGVLLVTASWVGG
jgi:hypothetical protein